MPVFVRSRPPEPMRYYTMSRCSCLATAAVAFVFAGAIAGLMLHMAGGRSLKFGCDFKDGVGCQIRFAGPPGSPRDNHAVDKGVVVSSQAAAPSGAPLAEVAPLTPAAMAANAAALETTADLDLEPEEPAGGAPPAEPVTAAIAAEPSRGDSEDAPSAPAVAPEESAGVKAEGGGGGGDRDPASPEERARKRAMRGVAAARERRERRERRGRRGREGAGSAEALAAAGEVLAEGGEGGEEGETRSGPAPRLSRRRQRAGRERRARVRRGREPVEGDKEALDGGPAGLTAGEGAPARLRERPARLPRRERLRERRPRVRSDAKMDEVKLDVDDMFRGQLSPGLPGKCAESCSANGNCNEETGRCECPIGRTGADCSVEAAPACRLSDKYTTECSSGNMGITTCACLEECAALMAPLGYDMMGWCFNVTSPEGREAVFKDPSSLAEHFMFGKSVGFTRLMEWSRTGRHPRMTIEDVRPLHECPASCRMKGSCIQPPEKKGAGGAGGRPPPSCRCFSRYRMADCSSFQGGTPTFCPGGCSGRGVCTDDGFCHCEPGRWGQDCALSMPPTGRGTPQLWDGYSPPAELRPKVYVYDLGEPGIHLGPAYLHLTHGWLSDFARPTEVMLRNRLLSSKYRTADPEEADYFYVPLMMGRQTLVTYLYISRRWDFWNKTNGANHIWFTVKDIGLQQATQPWPRSIPRISPNIRIPLAFNDTIFIQVGCIA